jgi:hypothetical protein
MSQRKADEQAGTPRDLQDEIYRLYDKEAVALRLERERLRREVDYLRSHRDVLLGAVESGERGKLLKTERAAREQAEDRYKHLLAERNGHERGAGRARRNNREVA